MIKTLFYNRTVIVKIDTRKWLTGFANIRFEFFNEISIYLLCFCIRIIILHKAKETK